MTSTWVMANAGFLLLCASMYLGTGWSLVLFQFPVADQLRPDNYYTHFVPQVKAATRFLTWMTIAMIASALLLTWTEWDTGYRWAPVVVLVGIIASTVLTQRALFPLNQRMAAGIDTEAELRDVLRRWTRLNRIRVGLWTVQWAAIVAWFAGNSL